MTQISVNAGGIEVLEIVGPDDAEFWENLDEEAEGGCASEGRYALVIGTLDDCIVFPGTPQELARIAALVSVHADRVQPGPDGAGHDPDDVSALVAHDAAAGLPGFTQAPRTPEVGTLAWAEQVLNALPARQRRAASDALLLPLVSMANAVLRMGSDVTTAGLLDALVDDLIDAAPCRQGQARQGAGTPAGGAR